MSGKLRAIYSSYPLRRITRTRRREKTNTDGKRTARRNGTKDEKERNTGAIFFLYIYEEDAGRALVRGQGDEHVGVLLLG